VADRPRAPSSRRPAAKKAGRKLGLVAILGIGAAALFGIAVCVLIVLSLIPSKEIVGVVQSVSWERTIEIDELQNVTKEDWRDRIPSGVQVGTCTQKHRSTQDNPAPNATEVCGTPYTVDTGTGHGQVVQDCEYKVYDDWCTYATREWRKASPATLSGDDYNPRWPDPGLTTNRRERDRTETYKVRFDTETKTYAYSTSDIDQFRQCQIGSRWTLKTNALGGVRSIQPAK
jgi:hypothetical protein